MSLGIRLQKILSSAGIVSRRAAEILITDGRVTVNRKLVTTLGTRADPAVDVVHVDGRRVAHPGPRRYLIVNKPRGYVTTRRDPEKRKTVLDLIPGIRDYVYPVGRLDYDSEGLLLLTNNGDQAHRLQHPSNQIEREYWVEVAGSVGGQQVKLLLEGIHLDDGVATARSARVLEAGDVKTTMCVVLTEGRKREVRRMLSALGHPVLRLRRIRFGTVTLDRLGRPGEWRYLDKAETDIIIA